MAKYLYLVKNHYNQLEADDLETEEILSKLKINEVVRVNYSKPRNYEHHKKFRAMINLVFSNQDKYETEEDLIIELKLRAGHYKEHLTLRGKVIYVPESLSFENCDQIEFEKFYNKAINICLKYFIKADNEELIQEIVRF